jgi:hypothetical protein
MRDPSPSDLLDIVFIPDGTEVPAVIRAWQARNADWRKSVEEIVECPVCGLEVRAIADLALLGDEGIREALREYREVHLRGACSDHWWPTLEYWAYIESQSRP